MKALELENVYYRQDDFLINNVSFSIDEGRTVALTGKTGSGKSTLVRLIGNAAIADSGVIRYFGKELYEDERNIRGSMSVIYDAINFTREMKASRLAKEIKKFEPDFSMERFEKYMEIFELDNMQRIRYFSTEMRKKYMLSLALSRNPRLLVMDEPTTGVSEGGRELMWKVIEDYRQNNKLSILFTTLHSEDITISCATTVQMEGGMIL